MGDIVKSMADFESAPAERERDPALFRALAAITSQPDLSVAQQTVVANAAALLHARWALLFVPEEEGGTLRVAAVVGPTVEGLPEKVSLGEGIAGRVARSRQPLVVDDYHAYEGRLATVKGTGAAIAVPVERGGDLFGVLALGDDSPGRHFGEGELALVSLLAAQTALAMENARLRREKEEFVSVVSHEFKTPLTAIKGYSQLVARRLGARADQATLQSLATIDQQASRLARLATDLVTYTRLESGHIRMETHPVDLVAVVRRSVEAARSSSDRHTLCLDTSEETLPIVGDPERIQRVVVSLLANAVNRLPDGGEVGVLVRRDGSAAVISVRDEGAGISPEQQASIFRRFYRSEQATMLGEGSGLGLAIARAIVEAHGGRIWVESGPEQGSTFHVSLPLS